MKIEDADEVRIKSERAAYIQGATDFAEAVEREFFSHTISPMSIGEAFYAKWRQLRRGEWPEKAPDSGQKERK